ncbi:MAG: ykuC-like MFS-type transporter [Frankiales bacterium]|nr:ykuC-like MFS-type transporter [Frankiales bacterium]
MAVIAGQDDPGAPGSGSSPVPGRAAVTSTWAPLAIGAYRALWIAGLVSNIGTWMQTVGAQWLLVDRPNSATLVALVQTASTLPVLLLALPAGVLADVFERRKLLIAFQSFQCVVGVVLTVLTVVGQMPPALLLSFTFLLGCGQALWVPAYQSFIPELVPRSLLPSASALGAVSINLARAVGPAIAGVLVARTGVGFVFGLNAATFLAFTIVLIVTRSPANEDDQVPERFLHALRAGSRFVRHSLVVRRIMLRSGLFVFPGSAMWALLPLVARERLGMDAGGYGLLLGAVGVGAVGGAVVMPRLRARVTPTQLLALGSIVYGASLVVLATVQIPWVVGVVLLPTGAAWIAVLASVNASLQLFLPHWVRGRGLSIYQIVLFGGQAVGALLWGLVAQHLTLAVSFLVASAVMVLGAATLLVWPMRDTGGIDRSTVAYWEEPHLAFDPSPEVGPVLVVVTYPVAPENAAAFVDAMTFVRRVRLRTGATRWEMYRDGEHQNRFVETYLVLSWGEHLRQHEGRLTGADRERESAARQLCDGEPEVQHLFPAAD